MCTALTYYSSIFYLSPSPSRSRRLSGLAKTHGVQIKASGAMLRLRLYQSLALIPPTTYEGLLLLLFM